MVVSLQRWTLDKQLYNFKFRRRRLGGVDSSGTQVLNEHGSSSNIG